MKILIVEDEERLAALVKQGLEEEGFLADVVDRGTDVLPTLGQRDYDAVVLDIQLPGLDGLEVCRQMRHRGMATKVLMLTARAAVDDRVKGLNTGADDYLTKPFAFEELVARLRALLRRDKAPPSVVLRAGRLSLDTANKTLAAGDQRIVLTAQEYLLMELLFRHPGQVMSREQIIDRAWGSDFLGDNRVVEVFVYGVRRKIEAAGVPNPIVTVRGLGYKLEAST
jgi:DNA-binding response OmpR family regulator